MHAIESTSTYQELTIAMAHRGCPVCRLEARSVARYLDSVFYESVNDVGFRTELRAAGGLCPAHARTAVDMGDVLGLAILGRDLLRAWAERGSGACPACGVRSQTMRLAVDTFVEGLGGEALAAAWKGSDPFCRRHWALVEPRVGSAVGRDQADKLEKIQRDLDALVVSFDYHHRSEPVSDAARVSWRLVWQLLTGEWLGGHPTDPL